jgi:hypothetical protein
VAAGIRRLRAVNTSNDMRRTTPHTPHAILT